MGEGEGTSLFGAPLLGAEDEEIFVLRELETRNGAAICLSKKVVHKRRLETTGRMSLMLS